MTLTTDLISDVIAYLVAQAQASPSIGGATPPVGVFNGPTPPGEPLTEGQRVWIGHDALSANSQGAQATQKWPFVGQSGAYRDETGEIMCTAEAWSGDSVLPAVRSQCKALVGFFENLLRGAPSTGGPGDSSMANLVQWSQVEGPITWHDSLDAGGASAMAVFRITYFARLAPN